MIRERSVRVKHAASIDLKGAASEHRREAEE